MSARQVVLARGLLASFPRGGRAQRKKKGLLLRGSGCLPLAARRSTLLSSSAVLFLPFFLSQVYCIHTGPRMRIWTCDIFRAACYARGGGGGRQMHTLGAITFYALLRPRARPGASASVEGIKIRALVCELRPPKVVTRFRILFKRNGEWANIS